MMTEAIGWASSLILLLTIGKQIFKQWQEGTSEGPNSSAPILRDPSAP
jgi:MtN3 and saliva related transmembrane protein